MRLFRRGINTFYFTIALLLMGPMAHVFAQSDAPVGSDQGNIEISTDGQAMYTLPVTVPPGVLGLSPKLTLSVSQTGQLNVGGLSSITRCTGAYVDHGETKPVRLLASDQYCLDGAPLVLVDGVQGEAGSIYHTQIESFQKIQAVGQQGNGPQYFKVKTRTGGTLYFGHSVLSRTARSADNTVLNWSISLIVDPSGNRLWYTYKDKSTNSTPEVVLNAILYGAKTSAAAPVRIDFEYEHNGHARYGYQYGDPVKSTQRLKQITTKADNKIARKYVVTYEQIAPSGASRVTKIHECPATGKCYRPSVFNYAAAQTGWQNASISQPSALQDNQGRSRGVVLDINNDGFNDWVIAVQPETGSAQIQTWLGSDSGWVDGTDFTLPGVLFDYRMNAEGIPVGNLADLNGDGLVDYFQAYFQYRDDGSTYTSRTTWLNTGNGFEANTALRPPWYQFVINADGIASAYDRYADVNGDGLVDAVRAIHRRTDADQPNASSHVTRLNTGSDWAVSSAYKLPSNVYFSDHVTQPEGIYQGELLDINGDGLVDFVQSAKVSGTDTRTATFLNTGSGWSANTAYQIPALATLMDYSVYDKGIPNAELVDINGDGLIDIWQALKLGANDPQYNAWLNNGSTFVYSNAYKPKNRTTYIRGSGAVLKYGELMDVDGDGKPEHVQHVLTESTGATSLVVYKHNGSGWVSDAGLKSLLPSIPFYMQPASSSLSSQQLLQLADLDGDGSAEAFLSQDKTNGWQVKTDKNKLTNGTQPGYLTQHTNGLGIETRLEYGLSTIDAILYTPADSTQNTRTSAAVNTPIVLVKTVKKMNGLIHPKTAKTNDQGNGWFRVNHQYGELKADLTGRGSLGFKTRTITDERTGIAVHSEFYQGYPFSGMPYKSRQQLGDTVLSTTETPSMEQKSVTGGLTTYIYAPQTIAKNYDPVTGDLLSTTTTTSTYDDYGNVLTKSQVTSGQVNNTSQRFEQFTDTTYENRSDGNDWLLGLPIRTEVTAKALDQPDQTNVTTASYNDEGYPDTETLQPGHPQSLTTSYTYDGFGNVKQTDITSGGDTRTSKAIYTADGRFPTTSINAKLHESKVEIDSRWGKPTKQTNANMLVKVTEYDGFGTVINEDTRWDGSPNRQARDHAKPYWCEGNDTCPANAVYVVQALDDQGDSPQSVYYDAYGRELLRQTTGADLDGNNNSDGPAIYVATEYDTMGRKKKTSRPGTNKSNLTYDEVVYDEFGRIKERISSDGTTHITYEGLTTITRNPEQQVSKVTHDLRGKPVASTDALNNVTQYKYDAKGNLKQTIDAENNVIEMSYDIFGRKTSMDDPDMGHWEYRYDGFGNLEWQKDAKDSITTMEYDELNRLEKRTDDLGGANQAITTWAYDTADRSTQTIDSNGNTQYARKGAAKGLLAYVSGPAYTRTHVYDQAGRPVKEITRINGGKDYISERGYYRASEKVAWEKYPSGLVLTKEYDPSGFPMKLESGDLEKYQAYLEEYYAYEDLVYRIKEMENDRRQQLDEYIELLKGDKVGEDENGEPEYAGGGLEDQVKPFIDKINQTVNTANTWQGYANEAGKLFEDHAAWYDAYWDEFEWYDGKFNENYDQYLIYDKKSDDEVRWGQEDANKATTHYNNYQTALNNWKNKWHAACKAMGKSIYGSFGQYRDNCAKGFYVEGKRYFGLGTGTHNVCFTLGMSAGSEQGGYETCTSYGSAYTWLPTYSKTIKEQSGYKQVCDNDSNGGGGGGNGVDAGSDFDVMIRWLADGFLDSFIPPSYAEGNNCWTEPNIITKTVKVIKGPDYGSIQSNLDASQSYVPTIEREGQLATDYNAKALAHQQKAQQHADTASGFAIEANKYVRGQTVYNAIANNHGLVALLLNDSKNDNNPANDTGRYAGYKKKVEQYAGVWQCKKIGQNPLLPGKYINGENPTTQEESWIENYDNPNVGPFKPSPIAGATLTPWDSDDKNGPEKWWINHTTGEMAAAEKLPIYKKHNCDEEEGDNIDDDELYAQISHGQLGTDIAALHNSKFFERNYIYYQYKELADPINQLVEQANSTFETVETLKTDYENSGSTYWEALAYAPDGQIKKAKYGNGVESNWKYDPRGRTYEIQAKKGSGDYLQNMFFDYDNIGNLVWRDDRVNQYDERFEYDVLNRLESSTLSGSAVAEYANLGLQSTNYEYDALGNLTCKSDVGNYTYGQGIGSGAGVHAVVSTSGTGNSSCSSNAIYSFAPASFSYDDNGNQISGNGRTVTYSPFNKPTKIVKGANVNDFIYGPERQLIYQREKIHDEYRETRYVGGIYEETIKDGNDNNAEAVHHLTMAGHTIAVLKTNEDLSQLNSMHYLHQDHLDSVVMITDNTGKVVEKNHYDPFGKKRLAIIENPTIYAAGFLPITDRSFTGHRYLPEQELVHMKGRVYDPVFGRFLSPDPHIQSPLNSQSLNRYSYVLNNPLSLTDPSGYFFSWFKKLFKKILKIIKKIIKKIVKIIKKVIKAIEKVITKIIMALPVEIRIIAAIVVAFYAPQIAASIGNFFAGAGTFTAAGLKATLLGKIAIGATGGFLAGLITTGSFKGALIGGLTGAAFAGVGSFFANPSGAAAKWGLVKSVGHIASKGVAQLTNLGVAAKALAHGVIGGLSSKLSGGSFSKSFLSTGLVAAFTPVIDRLGGGMTNRSLSSVGLRTGAAALLGGVAQKLIGGSFSMGARLGAFSRFFNTEGQAVKIGDKIEQWFKNQFSNFSRASDIMYEELHGGKNGLNDLSDAQRHANGMKRITEEIGPGTAAMVGTGHEIKNVVSDGQSLDQTLMDMGNNIHGISSGITGNPINDSDLLTIDQSVNGGYPSSQTYQDSPVVQAGGF